MEKTTTEIDGVLLLKPRVFGDERGFFLESYNQQTFHALGITDNFVQDNHSKSARGVLRGLHYQIRHAQAKLVRVVAGAVYDVAVDIRRGSPTFGKWYGTVLSAENKHLLYIPAGLAHGFYTLEDNTEFLYKCSDFYAPEYERTLLWNDPQLAVDWCLTAPPLLSEKDKAGTALQQISPADLPLF